MTLIHGKITRVEPNQIVDGQEVKFIFKDESIHRYVFNDNDGKVFFIVKEKNVAEETKYITLCEGIDECKFNYNSGENNNILKTSISINDLIYNNNFKIQLNP